MVLTEAVSLCVSSKLMCVQLCDSHIVQLVCCKNMRNKDSIILLCLFFLADLQRGSATRTARERVAVEQPSIRPEPRDLARVGVSPVVCEPPMRRSPTASLSQYEHAPKTLSPSRPLNSLIGPTPFESASPIERCQTTAGASAIDVRQRVQADLGALTRRRVPRGV